MEGSFLDDKNEEPILERERTNQSSQVALRAPRRAHFATDDQALKRSDDDDRLAIPQSSDYVESMENAGQKGEDAEQRPSNDQKQGDHANSITSARPPIRPWNASAISSTSANPFKPHSWTNFYRHAPTKTYSDTLKLWDGRIGHDNWFKVAARPFILFAYPSILWSAAVYSLSVGWLIVLSESVADIYRSADTYNLSAISTGLIYLSPFIGGILGTAVAGKLSDIVVQFMARRNGGIYEPEFRLVMAIPVALSTAIGLMGFGCSAQSRDPWIAPTIFFGAISFGCTLGSTTAISFAVDSYRQYAGEALVTLNFAKNIFHGLVFSLFFNKWLEADGAKDVFLALGGIQLGVLLFSIPMYIWGKRARMWTVRKNFLEKF